MSGMGLEWYKREPQAYLKDVQGMTRNQHAVYSIILDLIYAHGGSVNNDPRWIAGWVSDMGAAAVRRTIQSLVEKGTLSIQGDQIMQKRASSQVKRRENGEKAEENRGKNVSFLVPVSNKNSDLDPLEKRREEKNTPHTPQGGRRERVNSLSFSEKQQHLRDLAMKKIGGEK